MMDYHPGNFLLLPGVGKKLLKSKIFQLSAQCHLVGLTLDRFVLVLRS